MKAILIAVAVLAIIISGEAGAQTRAQAEDVRLALRDLRAAIDALPANLRSQRLQRATDWLVGKAMTLPGVPQDSTNPADVSDEYVRTLQRAAELLRQQRTAAVVEDVTLELEAKVEHCRRLGIGMGGTVLLKVNTQRDGVVVRNLDVKYLVKFFEFVTGATAASFPGESSPVEKDVPPGRYLIWASNPTTGQTSARKLVDVFGQKEIVVSLPVTFP
jgi:hypothetical protein